MRVPRVCGDEPPAPAFGFNTPFGRQLEFFRAKLNLPTERWDDIKAQANDRVFIVAGVSKADLLADLRAAVDKAIAEGTGLEAFRKDFRVIVQKHGWNGWTGEGSKAGEAWRTKVIYQTNMAMSYAVGRYRDLTDPAFLKLRPFWRYSLTRSCVPGVEIASSASPPRNDTAGHNDAARQ